MSNIQDIIKLAKIDGGKFFVMDEQGNASLVIMSIEEYQKMLLGKLQKQVLDVENINKEILKAQVSEPEISVVETVSTKRQPQFMQPDMRSEVIDPSFDFEAPVFGVDDF